MKNRIATIDIGTNSVLLTIAEKRNEQIIPVYEEATITRIGEGLSKNPNFTDEAIERTISVLMRYSEACERLGAKRIIAVGTAAMRKAKNSKNFIKRVFEETSLDIKVITGEREADLSFRASARDFGEDIIVIDIGGGSTEFIFKDKSGKINMTSLHLGGVTLQETFGKSDPINNQDIENMIGEINLKIKTLKKIHKDKKTKLVATAGTATTLAAMKLKLEIYNHNEVHGHVLKKNEIGSIIKDLKSKTIAERRAIPGLEPKRADVIFPGSLILKTTMDDFGFNEVIVSDRGVRWGLIYETFEH